MVIFNHDDLGLVARGVIIYREYLFNSIVVYDNIQTLYTLLSAITFNLPF